METRQIDLWGGEHATNPIAKGNRYLKMQEKHGKIEGKTCRTCANCVRYHVGKRIVYKCKSWLVTSISATDTWLEDCACGMYWEGKDD